MYNMYPDQWLELNLVDQSVSRVYLLKKINFTQTKLHNRSIINKQALSLSLPVACPLMALHLIALRKQQLGVVSLFYGYPESLNLTMQVG
jgi:hypothetical protein